MQRFTLPRDLYHGKGALEALKDFEGKKAIVCVGGGSMKRNGFLDRAVNYLKEAGMEVELFEGIEPDPSVETVMKGAAVMEKFQPDWIVAMGGGSPIDAAKAMGAGYIDGAEITDAFFYVSDAAKLDNIIEEVQNISSIDWNNFKITANNEVYENISASLSDTGTLITTLIVVITVVSMVLITLILSMSIRSRKKETGILLAVGIAKPAVILQYALETMLIAIVAFPLAYLSSKQVAGALGALFGKTAANVIVTPQHFMIVAVVGSAARFGNVILYPGNPAETKTDFGADGIGGTI